MVKVYAVLFIGLFEWSAGYASPNSRLISHRLQDGESLTDVAERYHTSLKEITVYNPFLLDKGIKVGENLKVPMEQVAEIYASKEKREDVSNTKNEPPRLLFKDQAALTTPIASAEGDYRDMYSIEKAHDDITSKKSFALNLSVIFNDGSSIILDNPKQQMELLSSLEK